MDQDGNIDITDGVEAMRATFVIWASDLIDSAIIAAVASVPAIGPILASFINYLTKKALSWALNKLSRSVVMLAFFENTVIRKGSQASDLVQIIKNKEALGPEVDDDTYEAFERNQMQAFVRLAKLTA